MVCYSASQIVSDILVEGHMATFKEKSHDGCQVAPLCQIPPAENDSRCFSPCRRCGIHCKVKMHSQNTGLCAPLHVSNSYQKDVSIDFWTYGTFKKRSHNRCYVAPLRQIPPMAKNDIRCFSPCRRCGIHHKVKMHSQNTDSCTLLHVSYSY